MIVMIQLYVYNKIVIIYGRIVSTCAKEAAVVSGEAYKAKIWLDFVYTRREANPKKKQGLKSSCANTCRMYEVR